MKLNEPSKFYVSSTRFNPEQDFENLGDKFPERVSSNDKRYEFNAIPVAGGNFGIIFKGKDRGYDLDQDVPVAMKIEKVSGEDDRIVKEARGLAKIKDRGVMEVREIVFINSDGREQMGVIYEWIDGAELNQFSPNDKLLYFEAYSQIADTLDRLHQKGIVHNDIRPKNILISTDATELRAVLTDWGISSLCSDIRDNRFYPYASPNALRKDSKFLPSDDNYSLLLCMYYTLAGHTAFKDAENKVLENYIPLSELEPLIQLLGGEVVKRLDDYFKDMLCGDQTRLSSAKKLIQDLSQIIPLEKFKKD